MSSGHAVRASSLTDAVFLNEENADSVLSAPETPAKSAPQQASETNPDSTTPEKQSLHTPPWHTDPCPRWREDTNFPVVLRDYDRNAHTVSLHEAGHATLALWFGLALWYAEIDPVRCTGQVRFYGSRDAAGPIKTRNPFTLINDESPTHAERQAVLDYCTVLAAGLGAERLYRRIEARGYVAASSSDQSDATYLLQVTLGHSRNRHYCQERARRLLVMHWPTVERIAAALEHSGRVPGVVLLAAFAVGLAEVLDRGDSTEAWPAMRAYIEDQSALSGSPRIALYCEVAADVYYRLGEG